jgi:Tol biopolymer transport system component
MSDLRTILTRGVGGTAPPPEGFERMLRRRDRKRRNQRIAAGVVGIAVFVVAVWIVTSGGVTDRTLTPVAPATTGPTDVLSVATAPWVPSTKSEGVDYLIDVNTGETTSLPRPIVRSLAPTVDLGRYAASPDGLTLAYVGLDDENRPQIFVAGLHGAGIHQLTNDPTGATSPAWSADGTRIAYESSPDAGLGGLFVIDVATGDTKHVIDVRRGAMPTFTPDGNSLLFTGGTNQVPLLRTVPIAGGESTLLIGAGEGIDDAGNGSMSPDGSLVTFLGSGTPASGEVAHCGPCRLVANADGTERRVIAGWMATPAGIWSPDGSRIVSMDGGDDLPSVIVVVDVATDAATVVARGEAAIWIDDYTLLVEV